MINQNFSTYEKKLQNLALSTDLKTQHVLCVVNWLPLGIVNWSGDSQTIDAEPGLIVGVPGNSITSMLESGHTPPLEIDRVFVTQLPDKGFLYFDGVKQTKEFNFLWEDLDKLVYHSSGYGLSYTYFSIKCTSRNQLVDTLGGVLRIWFNIYEEI